KEKQLEKTGKVVIRNNPLEHNIEILIQGDFNYE
ncbi:MAG: hypothetical protein K0R00_4346, partial [Herbinix sp.]|nr:hypothetical protein [Herbinix sp.]